MVFLMKILTNIQEFSEGLENAWDILGEISLGGPYNFLERVVGKNAANRLKFEGIDQVIVKDLRNCQMLYHAMRMEKV